MSKDQLDSMSWRQVQAQLISRRIVVDIYPLNDHESRYYHQAHGLAEDWGVIDPAVLSKGYYVVFGRASDIRLTIGPIILEGPDEAVRYAKDTAWNLMMAWEA